jgi:hypothetical protein
MTIKFTSERLVKLGFHGLTAEQYNELNSELYQATEEIVGTKLASRMTEQQLDEFEVFFNTRDDAGAFEWIEKEFPDYVQVVESVVAELEGILKDAVSELRAPLHPEGSPPPGIQEKEEAARS